MPANQTEATHQDTLRYVELTRRRKARYVATNRRGGTIEVGEGEDGVFTPVELLLTAPAALPRALQQSNDRLCTVGRTVQLASPVRATLVAPSDLPDD